LFTGTRESAEDPLSAAQAYEKTKQAIDEAELAAQEANRAATEAFRKVTKCFQYGMTIDFCFQECYDVRLTIATLIY
jgi:hypothetical protein